MATLAVQGFTGQLKSLNGTYTQSSRNHERPVFVKPVKAQDQQQSCVYFWDERDGEEMSGWWMAPEVGGEHVWTHNKKKDKLPPKSGWKVPWHGGPDRNVMFTYQPGSKGKGSQPLHYDSQNGKGKNDKGRPNFVSGAPVVQPRGKGKDASRAPPPLLGQAWQRPNPRQVQAQQKQVEQEVQRRQQEEQEQKMAEERRQQKNHERERANEKRKKEEEKRHLEKQVEEQTAKEASIKKLLDGDMIDKIKLLEDSLDDCQDASAVLTSDVADHLTPEDTMSSYDEGKDVIQKAFVIYTAANELVRRILKDMSHPLAPTAEIKELYDSVAKRLKLAAEPILSLRDICENYARKAKKKLHEKERLEKLEELEAQKKRANEWNATIVGRGAEDVILGELAVKRAKLDDAELPEAAMALRRTSKNLEEALNSKETTPESREELRSLLKRAHASLGTVAQSAKRVKRAEEQKKNVRAIAFSLKLQKLGEDGDFAKFSTDGHMSEHQFLELASSVEEPEDIVFVYTDVLRHTEKTDSINMADYQLYILARHLRVAVNKTILRAEATDTAGTELQKEEVVKILEIPTEHDALTYRVERLKDLKVGYVIDKNCFEPFSPRFRCVQETVLTDSLELKDFKVLKRLKEGDTFVVQEVPLASKATGLLRVRGLSGDVLGWTTIRGNQGTSYLAADRTSGPTKKETEEEIQPVSEETREDALQNLKSECMTQIDFAVAKVTEACASLENRSLELTAICDATPSEDDIKDVANNLNAAHALAQTRLTEAKVILLENARLVSKCKADTPLGHLRDALAKIPEQLNQFQNQALGLREHSETQIQQLRREAESRKQKEAMVRADDQVAAWDIQLDSFQEDVADEVKKTELIAEDCGELEPIETCVRNAFTAIRHAVQWIDEVMPPEHTSIGQFQKFRYRLQKFKKSIEKLSQRAEKVNSMLQKMSQELQERIRFQVGVGLRSYIECTSITVEQIFDGETEMSFEKFQKLLAHADIPVSDERALRRLFYSMGPVVRIPEFSFIAKPLYRVIKAAAMTDIFEIKASKNVLKLNEDDIVECIGTPTLDEGSKVMRIKAKVDDTEGYCTITGNAGTNFLVPFHPAFSVKVETVMTSIRQMRKFKVLRRLKRGEVIHTLDPPEREDDLLRVKGAMASDGVVGWVTVVGKGTRYLENCEREIEEPTESVIGEAEPVEAEDAEPAEPDDSGATEEADYEE